jgi:site-specific DNA recombinase
MDTAVAYLRVSTPQQAKHGYGLDNQREAVERIAVARGLKLAKVFEDGGVSGDAYSRPALDALYNMLAGGDVSYVLAYASDRFGRGETELDDVAFETMANIRRMGVGIITEREQDSVLMQKLLAVLGGEEKRKSVERLTNGKLASIRDGNVQVQTPPLGYNRVLVDKKWKLVPNEDEANLVMAMFQAYAAGDSYKAIAEDLTARGIPSKTERLAKLHPDKEYSKRKWRGKATWQAPTIRTILQNETYAGRHYYGKVKSWYLVGKDGKRKKRSQPRPKSEWLLNEVPPIIDEALFQKVQRRMKVRRHKLYKGRRPAGKEYVLRGRCHCAKCGKAVYVKQIGKRKDGSDIASYYCAGTVGKTCDLARFNRDKLENVVMGHVLKLLQDPKQLDRYLAERALEAKASTADKELARVEARLAEQEKKADRLIELYTDGGINRPTFDAKRATTDKQIGKLTLQQDELREQASAEQYDSKQVRAIWKDALARLERTLGKRRHWEKLVAIFDDLNADQMELDEAVNQFEQAGYTEYDLNGLMLEIVRSLDIECVLDSKLRPKGKSVTIRGKLIGESTVSNPHGKSNIPMAGYFSIHSPPLIPFETTAPV